MFLSPEAQSFGEIRKHQLKVEVNASALGPGNVWMFGKHRGLREVMENPEKEYSPTRCCCGKSSVFWLAVAGPGEFYATDGSQFRYTGDFVDGHDYNAWDSVTPRHRAGGVGGSVISLMYLQRWWRRWWSPAAATAIHFYQQ